MPASRRPRASRRARTLSLIVLFAVLLPLPACSSRVQMVAPRLPASYADLGTGSGEACGLQLLLFIPIMSRSTIDRAFEAAVDSVAGARSLRDVSITESWTWTPLGFFNCAEVSGTGIGPR